MSRFAVAVATCAFLGLLAREASGAAMDRDAALTKARAVRARVSTGETNPLWTEFDDGMRAALKDSLSFVAMGASIHAQLGAIDSVLDEVVAVNDTTVVVRSRCRSTRMPVPVDVTVAFTPAGRISTLLVRRARPHPWPTRAHFSTTRRRHAARCRFAASGGWLGVAARWPRTITPSLAGSASRTTC